jgi:hypothetical protein
LLSDFTVFICAIKRDLTGLLLWGTRRRLCSTLLAYSAAYLAVSQNYDCRVGPHVCPG